MGLQFEWDEDEAWRNAEKHGVSFEEAATVEEDMEQEGSSQDADMLREYDFERGVRGKYAQRYAEGTNVVVLSPEVARAFPDSASVNKALRALIDIARNSAVG